MSGTTLPAFPAATTAGTPSALLRLGAVVVAVAAFVPRLLRNRREMMLLAEADDAMLRDIGVTRQDVASALSEPLWRDPSGRLSDLSAERRQAARDQARERRHPVI